MTADTWEFVDRGLLGAARAVRIESGERVRDDSTATRTHILEPAGSRLLYDGVRVLTRLLGVTRSFGSGIRCADAREQGRSSAAVAPEIILNDNRSNSRKFNNLKICSMQGCPRTGAPAHPS